MTEPSLTTSRRSMISAAMNRMMTIAIACGAGGCVNVTAPNKPIEINLNITVTAETVVKFDAQAKSLIQQNPGIF